jgi:ferredoxin-NADP reductase
LGTRELAYFRAGQYLSLKVQVDGNPISRPYSISSAPFQALGPDGFYEITVRRIETGFFTSYLWDNWTVGTRIESSGPCGEFYYEPMRDAQEIVGLAGGMGITPFYSMAKEIVHGDLDATLLLLYGSSDKDEIVYQEELKALEEESDGKFKVVHVLSCDDLPPDDCEQGFITADLIKKYANPENSSFFICGPQPMYEFLMGELEAFRLPKKQIRREVLGMTSDITREPGFPREAADKRFQLEVHIGSVTTKIPALASEPVLVALERAGLAPPSQCRSGVCGFCHALVLSGDVFVHPDRDGRRAADRGFGYIHPCASYPVSDLEISVSRGGV